MSSKMIKYCFSLGNIMQVDLLSHFKELEDPRVDRTKPYPLIELISLIIRKEAAPENYVIFRHIAFNIISSRKLSKVTIGQ